MRANLLILGFFLAVCACLFAPPETALETPSPIWSVDGVSLGMTADQVRTVWGDLEESSLSDGLRCLHKSGRAWDGTNFAWFDPEGRVHCVTGHRLRRGQQLLVSTGMDFDPVELGEPIADPRISVCGDGVGVVRDKWFQLESDVLVQVEGLSLESVELPPGTDRAKILAAHPQFGRVSAVTLRRRELRSLLSEAPPWSSARK
ncbi:MAG: hypothetical protein AB7S38_01295 [Vulcanimicrobiota bacterium]